MDAVKVITVITLGGATLFALSARPRIPDAIGSRDDLSPNPGCRANAFSTSCFAASVSAATGHSTRRVRSIAGKFCP